MKSILVGLSLILATSASQAFFGFDRSGNEGGHGGGGVCDSKKCQTLAQAGITLKLENVSEFELEPEVIDEITHIINVLPFNATNEDKSQLVDYVVTSRGTLKLSHDQDSRSFKKYRNEYLKLLASSGAKVNEKNFQLLAASDMHSTFIFPGYFKLNTRGKALLMIHEFNIRWRQSLQMTLVFDGLIQDYLQRYEAKKTSGFDYWNFNKVTHEFGLGFSPSYTEGDNIINLIDRAGGRIKWSGFCELSKTSNLCGISRAQALRLRTYHPAFAQAYSDVYLVVSVIKTWNYGGLRNDFHKASYARIKSLCKQDSSVENYLFAGDLDGDGLRGLYVIECSRK
jgi:hypothetical protein